MRKLNRWIRVAATALLLAAIWTLPERTSAQTTPTPTPSVESLPTSDTRVSEGERRKEKGESQDQIAGLIRAAAEAAEELRAARILIEKQTAQIDRQQTLIEMDAAIIEKYRELRGLDAEEKGALRGAIEAKNRQIAATEEEVKLLKRQRGGFWKTVKTVVVSAAAGLLLGAAAR